MKNFINWSSIEPACPAIASSPPPASAFSASSVPYFLLSATADSSPGFITSSQLPNSVLGSTTASKAAEYLAALVSNSQLANPLLMQTQTAGQFNQQLLNTEQINGSATTQTSFPGHNSATEALIAVLAQSAHSVNNTTQRTTNNNLSTASFGQSLANNLVASVTNPAVSTSCFPSTVQSSPDTLTPNAATILSSIESQNSPTNLPPSRQHSAFQLVGGLPQPNFPVLQHPSLQLHGTLPLLSQLVNQREQQQQHQLQQQIQSTLENQIHLPSPSSIQELQQQTQVESQMSQAAAAAVSALYPSIMCKILQDHLGPALRPSLTSTQFKPIPQNERIDIKRFRGKEPHEWSTEDVIAWLVSVARRNDIPFEDFNVNGFAKCSGPLLMLMNEQRFRECDSKYGSLIYVEFRKLISDDTCIDDWMRTYKEDDQRPSTSNREQNSETLSLNLLCPPSQNSSQTLNGLLAAASPRSPFANNMAFPQQALLQKMSPIQPQMRLPIPIANIKCEEGVPSTSEYRESRPTESSLLHGVSMKIKRNKDGRPRKRSQHTKGNKLWEFIREALKDPSTCPSVVRWEDPHQGVFRIVESERLARLWGEKKNNKKMTYEKLSRAMRTYYEKQILVPVPKTGLYPKKLVYKFGPGAHGWCAPPSLVTSSLQMDQHENMS
jgi:ETS factor family protein